MSVANTIQVLSNAEISADGLTDWFKLPTATMGELIVEVVSGSGTITQFDLWAQTQAAEGAAAADILWDRAVKSADSETEGTARANIRDVVDAKSTTTAEYFWAAIAAFTPRRFRLKWKFAGTSTPKLVVNAWLVVK